MRDVLLHRLITGGNSIYFYGSRLYSFIMFSIYYFHAGRRFRQLLWQRAQKYR